MPFKFLFKKLLQNEHVLKPHERRKPPQMPGPYKARRILKVDRPREGGQLCRRQVGQENSAHKWLGKPSISG
jgi:hypothetical protein